ncbi:hypothetical protein UCRPC4_g03486 [Phaeomoniella chlamydospora]|uniref:Rhodopsin domain-containing protein n=1 Tax=Phaeomoniella chlamydospora TaxID=158046 RepID=A0A0G2EH14_PHACM|nr:hypothetical protein UCRPC4_g03486 [Phaeomoniella chlamydospora]
MGLPIEVESWIWYTVAMTVLVARYFARYLMVGSIKKFSYEDYIMLVVACTYTILIVLLNIVMNVSTNLIEPEDIPGLTADDIAARVRGSKLVIVVEQMMCLTIWLCKACLLLMYNKLTLGLRANLACKIVGGYVAGTFIIMEILYFGVWCRPFRYAWVTPTPKVQCATQTHHLITNLVFNLTSDICMLAIPIPLLLKSQLPLARKIILVFIFSLGCFVMLSAILSKVYSFKDPFSADWIFWYTREASTAIIVTNMPHTWALLRRVFHLKSFIAKGSATRGRSGPTYYGAGTSKGRTDTFNDNKSGNSKFFSHLDKARSSHFKSLHSRSESQERIKPSVNGHGPALEIWQDVQFRVSHSEPYQGPVSAAHHDDDGFHPPGGNHSYLGTKSDAIALKEIPNSSIDSNSESSSSSTAAPSLTRKTSIRTGTPDSHDLALRSADLPGITVSPPERIARIAEDTSSTRTLHSTHRNTDAGGFV